MIKKWLNSSILWNDLHLICNTNVYARYVKNRYFNMTLYVAENQFSLTKIKIIAKLILKS